MFRLTTESQNSPIHTKAVQVPRNARVPLSSQNSASSAAACSLPASNPTLPASNSTFPVSKATAEPRRWMHKGGNRDPTAFSSLSIISHCSKKESPTYKCESFSSKMSAYGFFPHLFVMGDVMYCSGMYIRGYMTFWVFLLVLKWAGSVH